MPSLNFMLAHPSLSVAQSVIAKRLCVLPGSFGPWRLIWSPVFLDGPIYDRILAETGTDWRVLATTPAVLSDRSAISSLRFFAGE